MGFTKPNFPPFEPETFLKKPLMERIKILALNWAENGYGAPTMVHTIYIVKLAFFYALGGVVVATVTSGPARSGMCRSGGTSRSSTRRLILWTVLLEIIGVAGSWGPLAGKFKPMTGGILFWARPGTIRLRPWRWVPLTAGNRRTWFDVALYVALIVSVVVPLVLPGVHSDSLSAAIPSNTSGLVNPALLVAPMVLLVLIGLRDKTIFLAARGEQYLPALFFFAVLPFVDMIIALKLLIVRGVDRRRCLQVRPALHQRGPADGEQQPACRPNGSSGSTTATSRMTSARRMLPASWRTSPAPSWKSLPRWPAALTTAVADAVAARLMVAFHLFIISTFPLAVPLEWNVLFAYARSSCSSASRRDGYGVARHVLAVADRRHPGRPAVLPGAGQPAPRPGVVPALDAPVRGQLGLCGVGLRARRRGEAEPGDPLRPQPGRPAGRLRLRAAVGRDLDAAADRLAVHAQPGPRPVLGAAQEPSRHRHPDRA